MGRQGGKPLKHGISPRKHAVRSHRQLQVGEEIKRALADVLTRMDFHDPELQDLRLTVSEVRISPDLKRATVFCWPFAASLGVGGNTPAFTSLVASLKRAEPYIRHQLGRSVYLRALPHLDFVLDHTFDNAQKMENLLTSLATPATNDAPTGTASENGNVILNGDPRLEPSGTPRF